jgi:hypothetical protein
MRSKGIGSRVPGGTRRGRAGQAGPGAAVAGRRLACGGAVLVVLTMAACSSAGGTGTGGATASPSPAAASTGAASSLEQQYEQVVARVLPSVVQIRSRRSPRCNRSWPPTSPATRSRPACPATAPTPR